MKNNIEIRYRHLPSEITDDFRLNLEKTDLTFEIIHDKKEYFNAIGGPADLLLYIDEHLTDIIVGGILYDFLKYPFMLAWKKLVQHYKQKKAELQEDKNYCEVNFILHEDKTIQFALNGDIDEKTINNAVDRIFEYLKDKSKHDKDLQNPEFFTPHSLKPRIRLQFNSESNRWEVVNFAERKKEIEEFMRQAQQNIND